MSIRLRLTLVYGLLLALTLLGFDLLLYWTLERNLSREFDDSLRLRAAGVAHEIHPGRDGRLGPADIKPGDLEPASLENSAEPGAYVQVIDPHGVVIGNSGTLLPVEPTLLSLALHGGEAVGNARAGQEETIRSLFEPIYAGSQAVGAVQASQSLRFLESTLSEVRGLLLFGSLGALAAAGLAGWLVLGRALRPLARATAVARRIIATGRLEARIADPGPPDEAGELARAFNLMVDRLSQAFEQQRQLVADTSHELRNPLTALRGNLDILQQDLEPEERNEVVLETKDQAAHMSRLVADLLLLARADAGLEIEHQPVALHDLVQRLYQRAAGRGSPTVRLDRCEPATVIGDRDRLQQLLWNLIENALRYTPADGEVRLALRATPGQLEFSVEDTGPGIAPEHLERIFERFYRIDKARSRRSGGTGLGLAIARYLADAHGGDLRVASRVGKGSVFTLRLPTASEVTVGEQPAAIEELSRAGVVLHHAGPER
jgi:two-component system, OmpR family, sensor kinase